MSIEYGLFPLSADAFAWYAWNVCVPLKRDPREAYEWGHLGMLLAQKYSLKHSDRARIRHHYYCKFYYYLDIGTFFQGRSVICDSST